ncbi:MAG: prepilin-type N-terminal cleavage/methylation domain-containing protein [Lentisphaeraceae bacterium]|nr:prepilin-type N-terminal cleavage/methylation domain-containing protein [Lentisphaeraceae bacterium]
MCVEVINKKFTLIELLVVVAIIGILSSILLPSLSKAREKAKMTVCQVNQKQIGAAAFTWNKENDYWSIAANWYSKGWNASLYPYTSTDGEYTRDNFDGLYHCPSLTRELIQGTSAQGYGATSYATHSWSTGYQSGKPLYNKTRGHLKVQKVNQPQQKVLMMDHTIWHMSSWSLNPQGIANRDDPTRWHGKYNGIYAKANILWYDGHVSIEPSDFARNDWRSHYFDPTNE